MALLDIDNEDWHAAANLLRTEHAKLSADIVALESQLTEAREAVRDVLDDKPADHSPSAAREYAKRRNAKLARLRKSEKDIAKLLGIKEEEPNT